MYYRSRKDKLTDKIFKTAKSGMDSVKLICYDSEIKWLIKNDFAITSKTPYPYHKGLYIIILEFFIPEVLEYNEDELERLSLSQQACWYYLESFTKE